MNRAFLVACLTITAGLAGCTDPALDEVSVSRTVIHGAAAWNQTAQVYDAETWTARTGLDVPEGGMRYTGRPTIEPTIGSTSTGTLFMASSGSGPHGWERASRSFDGARWIDVTPNIMTLPSYVAMFLDPFLHVDRDTDRVFIADMEALACVNLSYSDDEGHSWLVNPLGCGHPVGVHDHHNIVTAAPRVTPTVGYPNLVYYCVNRIADTACATSNNGGITFGALRPLVFAGVEPGREGGFGNGPVCGGLTGHAAASSTGIVYLPKAHCGTPTVAVTYDDGLTWHQRVISDLPTYRVQEPSVFGGDGSNFDHEVAIALDDEDNLYAMWIAGDLRPYLATSTDEGRTWSDPIAISPPSVQATEYPTIAAAGNGSVVAAYFGTESEGGFFDLDENDTWNGYLTAIINATGEPILASTTVNDPDWPLARGVCGGTRCGRNVDFIDVTIDPYGRPWASMVDACTNGCKEDARRSDRSGFVGTWETGSSLLTGWPLAAVPPTPATWFDQPGEGRFTDTAPLRHYAAAHALVSTNPIDEDRLAFDVFGNASAILVEVEWSGTGDVRTWVWYEGSAGPVAYEESANNGPNGTRIVLKAAHKTMPGNYLIGTSSDLAVDLQGTIAVTVFYDGAIPDDYTALP